MEGFCESCGRHPNRLQRARGRGIAPCPDGCELYLCPNCQHAEPLRNNAPSADAGLRGGSLVLAGVAAIVLAGGGGAMIVVGGAMIISRAQPTPTGEVLALRQAAPIVEATTLPPRESPVAPSVGLSAAPSPAGTAEAPPSLPLASATPVAPAARLSIGEPAVRTWRGAFGELRLQVILEVRNAGSVWMRLPRSASTYQVFDQTRRPVAGGIFAAALPELVGPGETSYLIDTLSAAFGKPSDFRSARATVNAAPAQPPEVSLSVSSVELSTGTDGGLRAVAQVQNDGQVAARSIIAGIIVFDRHDRPIAGLYDLTDVTQLAPGERIQFATDYPGAPPVGTESLGRVRGLAFTTDD